MDSVRLGVRKGAWTEEEDVLLKKCIEKNGEGKWHQVPLRAGLNRCRKSCRLRWLNYLRPNIKRGNFGVDEVDLIIRLHRLLGNRWSLIAGRLPRRTANDVKNYWNTHLKKKLKAPMEEERAKSTQRTNMETKVIRPRPRTTTSKNLPPCWLRGQSSTNIEIRYNTSSNSPPPLQSEPPAAEVDDDALLWWENMLIDPADINKEITWSVDGSTKEPIIGHWTDQKVTDDNSTQETQSDWCDILINNNVDLWDVLGGDEQSVI